MIIHKHSLIADIFLCANFRSSRLCTKFKGSVWPTPEHRKQQFFKAAADERAPSSDALTVQGAPNPDPEQDAPDGHRCARHDAPVSPPQHPPPAPPDATGAATPTAPPTTPPAHGDATGAATGATTGVTTYAGHTGAIGPVPNGCDWEARVFSPGVRRRELAGSVALP